jgi:hypothetical protein
MSLPKDSANAEQFIVIATHRKNETLERQTYVFRKSTTLEEIFSSIFAEGRTEWPGSTLPFSLEILPDLSCLPVPKTILESVNEFHEARANSNPF